MVYDGQEIDFPGINKLSFFKLFEHLEAEQNHSDPVRAERAKRILHEMEPYPELREGVEDPKRVEELKPQIDILMDLLFPAALTTNEIKAAMAPMTFEPIHMSDRLQSIMNKAPEDFQLKMQDFDADVLYLMGCSIILGFHYRFPVNLGRTYHIHIPNAETGVTRVYRTAYNADMMEVIPTEKSKDLTMKDFHELMDDFENIDLWKEKIPPGSWILRGLGLMTLMDVTVDHTITQLTSTLMGKNENGFEIIQGHLQLIFNLPDLQLGFSYNMEGSFAQVAEEENMRSLVLNKQVMIPCSELLCDRGSHMLMNAKEPMIISDMNSYHKLTGSLLGESLKKQGFGSFIIAPLIHEGNYLGFMELGHPKSYVLNNSSLHLLQEIIPLLALAASNFTEETNNRIEAIIQQECTTIHTSVKWRFEEEARRYMVEEDAGRNPQFSQIGFKDVYPLYGQLDIKGSSTSRNEAVKKDLTKQMSEVKKLLRRAHKLQPLPVLQELAYRVNTYLKEIEDGLMAGSEHKILAFLREEIYPVFRHLGDQHAELRKSIDAYNKKLDPKLNMVYEARKNFDESVALVNNEMASFIDDRQDEAQAMFPHYFERYKTDGVEYNLYIGDSMAQNKEFHGLYLRNLRLWQLLVMCEMERHFYSLSDRMGHPLEIASLVLVYSQSLSIQFRLDEKRFDVDGAYNARYEIVKKRVDKAHIKDSDERITVPYKIAIIYTSEQDAQEYRKYIEYLQAVGYLKDEIEDHDLEDLQGITGLKALRVSVNYLEDPQQTVSYSELIESLGTEA